MQQNAWSTEPQNSKGRPAPIRKPIKSSKPLCATSSTISNAKNPIIQALLFHLSARSTKPNVAGATSGLLLGCVTPLGAAILLDSSLAMSACKLAEVAILLRRELCKHCLLICLWLWNLVKNAPREPVGHEVPQAICMLAKSKHVPRSVRFQKQRWARHS